MQFVHIPPSEPVLPELHLQAVTEELPAIESALSGHVEHKEEPLISLNLPVVHGKHTPPPGPVLPSTHRQSVTVVLLVGDDVFAGQALHCTLSDPAL